MAHNARSLLLWPDSDVGLQRFSQGNSVERLAGRRRDVDAFGRKSVSFRCTVATVSASDSSLLFSDRFAVALSLTLSTGAAIVESRHRFVEFCVLEDSP